MKGSMKKLAVLVIIVAIAMFFVGAMASADDHTGKKAVQGQYAGTGGGTCIIALGGFYPACDDCSDPSCGCDKSLTPICTGLPAGTPCGIVQWYSREGDYTFTFKHDGTGSVTATGRVVAQYFSSSGSLGPPYAGSNEVSYNFTYTVDHSGMVTITQVPGTYFSEWTEGPAKGKIYKVENYVSTGLITPDGKGMNQASGAPAILTLQQVSPTQGPEWEMICNFDTVLIWQHD
jgi:hypothetical protein